MEEAAIIVSVDGCRCLRSVSFVGGVKDLVCLLFQCGPYFCRDTACVGEFLWLCTGLFFGSGNVVAINVTRVRTRC